MDSGSQAGGKFPKRWLGQFARQELKSKWKPLPSKEWTIGFYLVVAAVFVAVGSVFLTQTLNVVEYRERYDDKGLFQDKTSQERYEVMEELNTKEVREPLSEEERGYRFLTFTMSVTREMKAPIYVYYELSNFYQNHKRYVRSLDSQQLGGASSTAPAACDPKSTLKNAQNESESIFPCGLIAASFFNDSFTLQMERAEEGAKEVSIDGNNISWEWDRKYLYSGGKPQNYNPPENRYGASFNESLNENERFMVWMRVAAAPTARKLYGRIDETIPKGTKLTFTAENNYNTYKFTGKKFIVLSTANWTGGRNIFTGVLYIVIGCLSFLAAVSFLLTDLKVKRPPADLRYLSWERKTR